MDGLPIEIWIHHLSDLQPVPRLALDYVDSRMQWEDMSDHVFTLLNVTDCLILRSVSKYFQKLVCHLYRQFHIHHPKTKRAFHSKVRGGPDRVRRLFAASLLTQATNTFIGYSETNDYLEWWKRDGWPMLIVPDKQGFPPTAAEWPIESSEAFAYSPDGSSALERFKFENVTFKLATVNSRFTRLVMKNDLIELQRRWINVSLYTLVNTAIFTDADKILYDLLKHDVMVDGSDKPPSNVVGLKVAWRTMRNSFDSRDFLSQGTQTCWKNGFWICPHDLVLMALRHNLVRILRMLEYRFPHRIKYLGIPLDEAVTLNGRRWIHRTLCTTLWERTKVPDGLNDCPIPEKVHHNPITRKRVCATLCEGNLPSDTWFRGVIQYGPHELSEAYLWWMQRYKVQYQEVHNDCKRFRSFVTQTLKAAFHNDNAKVFRIISNYYFQQFPKKNVQDVFEKCFMNEVCLDYEWQVDKYDAQKAYKCSHCKLPTHVLSYMLEKCPALFKMHDVREWLFKHPTSQVLNWCHRAKIPFPARWTTTKECRQESSAVWRYVCEWTIHDGWKSSE